MYIQVNFGRNIGTAPMTPLAWETFTNEIVDAVTHYTFADDAEIHTGSGEWAGVKEESRKVSVFVDGTAELFMSTENYNLLRGALKDIREAFSQDSVALIVTDSELI